MRSEKAIRERISNLTAKIGEIQDDIRIKSLAGDRALKVLQLHDDAKKMKRFYDQIAVLEWVLGKEGWE